MILMKYNFNNSLSDDVHTTAEAKHDVAKRKVYGAVHFPRNFSDALAIRVTEGHVEDDVIDESTISAWIDLSGELDTLWFFYAKVALDYNRT